jgi:hypothetical protein
MKNWELAECGSEGARHGQGARLILETVLGLVRDRCAGTLLGEAAVHATALDHETIDNAMEDSPVVMAIPDVLLEIGGGARRLFKVKFNVDVAVIGREFDHVSVSERGR